MTSQEQPSTDWAPPPRPDWLKTFLDESKAWNGKAVAPLQADELIETAIRQTGFNDFGPDDWREPFHILVKAIEEEADLNLFGRLWTRQELVMFLETRLRIEAEYKAHPEIEDEEIDQPVFVTGLPRSGTSILFELLAQDQQFLAPANWEFVLPCPPPEAETYCNDPRVPRAHDLITQMGRVAPTYQAMHEMGAWIPNECGVAFRLSFRSQHLAATFQVPTYTNWLFAADQEPAYRYYKRLLKLLQWKNPRGHWLLKAPEHQSFLPVLFKVFPDARVVITHRDPVKAQGSVTNLMGTIYWMRSDKPFDAAAFEELLTPEGTAARLDQMIDWIDGNDIPAGQISHSRYADLMQEPVEALEALYAKMQFRFTAETRAAVNHYLEQKPKGKFGSHHYAVDREDSTRQLFARYQSQFDVPSEE
ncbi:sulfotransferase [Croceicoccus sp. F390]|uniref:Sulfotransferase n=1 Tax=Croceicoccus esteveae TaxID=3075597 RepID=A0ABU2ZKK9_9SPHN|nr:sulfotransferase [Croceicoccus sp. F390]MDT0577133.1 sulfotransferase [Croceicoccus sp. F390]